MIIQILILCHTTKENYRGFFVCFLRVRRGRERERGGGGTGKARGLWGQTGCQEEGESFVLLCHSVICSAM